MRFAPSMSGVAATLAVTLICGTPGSAKANAPQVPPGVLQFAMTVPMNGRIQYAEPANQTVNFYDGLASVSGTITAYPSEIDAASEVQSKMDRSVGVVQVFFHNLTNNFRDTTMIVQNWFSAVGAADVEETMDGPKAFHVFRAADGRPVFKVSTRKGLLSLLSGAQGAVAARVRASLPLKARVWTSKGLATLTITSIKHDRATFSARMAR